MVIEEGVLSSGFATSTGVNMCMRPVNERRRYIVTSSLIGWPHSQNMWQTNDDPGFQKYVIITTSNMLIEMQDLGLLLLICINFNSSVNK